MAMAGMGAIAATVADFHSGVTVVLREGPGTARANQWVGSLLSQVQVR